MGGGSVQLQSKGKQDTYLTGNPDISYFKFVYHKHTNFAIEQVEHNIETNNSTDEWKGELKLEHGSADFIYKTVVELEFTAGTTLGAAERAVSTNYLSFTNGTGYAYIKDVAIFIGERQIDKHYSKWFDIYNELTDINLNEYPAVNKHASKSGYYKGTKNPEADLVDRVIYLTETDTLLCYVPLIFWFTKKPSLALPLLQLYHSSVKFVFTFRKLSALFNSNTTFSNPTTPPNIKVYVDYIILDKEERHKIANQKANQILIEQLQYADRTRLTKTHDIVMNHPVKEIFWIISNDRANTEGTDPATNGADFDGTVNISSATSNFGASWNYNDFFNYACPDRTVYTEVVGGSKSFEPFDYATIKFSGAERLSKRRPSYFRVYQPLTYHTRVPTKHIYMYSFGTHPEQYEPSGTANFSIIRDVQVIFDNVCDTGQLMSIEFFAVNYNVLAIYNGQAGLLFNN